ncbi:MAG: helix-turn-helix domain-containing protein [Hyphomicrobium sp.]|nr:helix-turn-helix domain-containing protein [Hyphomicrobium sp.]
MAQAFGEKLRRMRTARRLTLDELAAKIGSTKAYVWQLENKPNARPSAELLLKIADALEAAPDYFIDDTIENPTADQIDRAFFRKFQRLSEADKLLLKKK